MPQIFRVGSYVVYFWSNKNNPVEPIHVHVSEGRAFASSTKIWITNSGKALICNNNSRIPDKVLKNIMRQIEANSEMILDRWREQFGEIRYYC
ncbi:MAG: DUF4160 domain-containing protein [Eubacterium sp.]|nr:DUF4160 domain-containing protein [Eubacterium sp.]